MFVYVKELKLILYKREKVRDAKTEFKLIPLFKYGQWDPHSNATDTQWILRKKKGNIR